MQSSASVVSSLSRLAAARLFPEFGMTDHDRRIYLIPDASEEEEDEAAPPRRLRIDMRRQLMRDYDEVAAFPEFGEV